MTSAARSTPDRPRNRRGEGARLRDEIVAAAVALLEESGDEAAVTLRSVARRVGVAAPSIYRHFDGQPQIMLAVVEQAFAELAAVLGEAASSAGESPRDRVVAVSAAYLGFAQERPGTYRTMFGGVWMPRVGDEITAERLVGLGDEALGILAAALRACVAAGQSSSQDPPGDAVAVWLGLHGLAHQRLSTRILAAPEDIELRLVTALAQLTP